MLNVDHNISTSLEVANELLTGVDSGNESAFNTKFSDSKIEEINEIIPDILKFKDKKIGIDPKGRDLIKERITETESNNDSLNSTEGEKEEEGEEDEEEEEEEIRRKEGPIFLQEVFTPDYNVTEEEVAEYAHHLGIGSDLNQELFCLAKKALLAPLPRHWTPVKDKSNGIYYFNQETGESSWVHPVDASLKEFIRRSKRREKDAADTDSCLEELKTEEDSLYLKEGDQTFSPQNTQDKNTSKDLSESLHNCSNNQENMVDRGFGSLPQLSNGLPPLGPIKHPLGQLKGKPPHAASPSPDHMISLEQLPTPGRNFSPSPLQAKELYPPRSSSVNSMASQVPYNLKEGGRLSPLKSIMKDSSARSGGRYSQNFKSPSKTLRFQNEYDSSDEEVEIEYQNDTHSLNIQKSKSDSAAGKEIEDSYNDPKAVTKSDFEDLKTKNLKTSTKTLAALKPSPILDKPVNEPAKSLTSQAKELHPQLAMSANPQNILKPLDKKPLQTASSVANKQDDKKPVSNSSTATATATPTPTKATAIPTKTTAAPTKTTTTAPAKTTTTALTKTTITAPTKTTTTAPTKTTTAAPTKTINSNKIAATTTTNITATTKAVTTVKTQNSTPTTSQTAASSVTASGITTSKVIPNASTTPAAKAALPAKNLTPAAANVNSPSKSNAVTTTKSATTSKVANTTTKTAPSSVAQPVSSTVKQNDPKPAVSNSGNIKTTSASTTSSTTSTTTITTNKVLKTSATTSTAPATNKAPATTVSASNISTKQTTTASPAPKTNAPTKTTNATTPAQSKPITSVSTSSQAKTTPSTSKAVSVVNKPTLSQTVSTMPPATGKSPVSAKIPSTVNNIVPNKESTIQKKTEPQLELESNLKIKRSNPMEILNAKFGNKSINKDLENSDEDSEDVRVDGAYGFLRDGDKKSDKMTPETQGSTFCTKCQVKEILAQSEREEFQSRLKLGATYNADFLLESEEDIFRDAGRIRSEQRKQRLNLIEESLNLEKSMNELLQERQRELKKEHEKTMNRLKEDLSYSLERIHKEAENMEDTEKSHQLSRISFLKEKHKLEVENLQRIHHDFIENLRGENDFKIEEMKRELNKYLKLCNDDVRNQALSLRLESENMKKILEEETMQKSRKFNQNREEVPDKYARMFLSEFKSIRKEIEKLKNSDSKRGRDFRNRDRSDDDSSSHSNCEDHSCQYGSKYAGMKKKYNNLIKQIKKEKKRKRRNNSSYLTSDSSGSSSPALDLRNSFSESENFASYVRESIEDPIESEIEDIINPISPTEPTLNSWLNDPLLQEGRRVLKNTESFLKSSRYLGSDIEIPELEHEDDFLTDRLTGIKGNENVLDFLQSDNEFELPSFNEPNPNLSNKSELDLMLENIASRRSENVNLTPKHESKYVRNEIANAPFRPSSYSEREFKNTPFEFASRPADDFSYINNYIRNKWRSYFGDEAVPLGGKAGWPSKWGFDISHPTKSYSTENLTRLRNPSALQEDLNLHPSSSGIRQKIEGIRAWLSEAHKDVS